LIILIILDEVYKTCSSTFRSLHPSSVQIFSSAPCSETPSVYVPPVVSETRVHTLAEANESERVTEILTVLKLIFIGLYRLTGTV
jgi:hypothetical protein